MLSIRVGGAQSALEVVAKLRVWVPATSLGGVESLVEHRYTVEGPTRPTPPDLLRLSVGLEHEDDLFDDLARGAAHEAARRDVHDAARARRRRGAARRRARRRRLRCRRSSRGTIRRADWDAPDPDDPALDLELRARRRRVPRVDRSRRGGRAAVEPAGRSCAATSTSATCSSSRRAACRSCRPRSSSAARTDRRRHASAS